MFSTDEVFALQEFLKKERLNYFGEPSGVMCSNTYRAYKVYLQSVNANPENYNVNSVSHLEKAAQEFVRSYKKIDTPVEVSSEPVIAEETLSAVTETTKEESPVVETKPAQKKKFFSRK